KVVISVGGASYPNWSSFNPASVAAFVRDFGLDGVDIDYEPANPACSNAGGRVSCPSDSEYINIVTRMRQALPPPSWWTIAAFSVGAFGEGQWASAQPASAYTGISINLLRSSAGAMLDVVHVMSYDASSVYNPIQALAAYQTYFRGR